MITDSKRQPFAASMMLNFQLLSKDLLNRLTIGQRHILASVIVNVAIVTGLKSRILGYISIGDRVCKDKYRRK